jgi:hypothetical protein
MPAVCQSPQEIAPVGNGRQIPLRQIRMHLVLVEANFTCAPDGAR